MSNALERYKSKAYNQVHVLIPAGAREKLKALAAAEGVSLNRYILEAVEQRSGLKLTLDKPAPWTTAAERAAEKKKEPAGNPDS